MSVWPFLPRPLAAKTIVDKYNRTNHMEASTSPRRVNKQFGLSGPSRVIPQAGACGFYAWHVEASIHDISEEDAFESVDFEDLPAGTKTNDAGSRQRTERPHRRAWGIGFFGLVQ